MNKRQFITIAGRPGSGKSTAAKGVAEKLGFTHFSSGDLFRQLAKERGVDVMQANISAEQNEELDHLVDERLQQLGRTANKIVIDSRMAWHWVPDSFKVFLDLDLETAADRILGKIDERRRHSEHITSNPAEYAEVLKKRLDSEARRYKKLYNANPYQTTNYDLVINTSTYSAEHTLALILEAYRKWQA